MPLKQEISSRIKQVREHFKMSPTEFSVATKVKSQTIRDYENAKSIPGGAFLAALTELGVSVEWVLTGVGSINYKFNDTWPVGLIHEPNKQLNQDVAPYQAPVELRSAADVNMTLLEVAVLAVHRYYASEGVVAAPERMAKLIVAIYKYAAAKGAATPEELDQFLKLII